MGFEDRPWDKLSQFREEVEPGTESSLGVKGGIWVFDIVSVSPRFEIALLLYKIVPGGDIVPYLPGLEFPCEGVLDLHIETGKVFPDIDLDGGFFLRPVDISSGGGSPLPGYLHIVSLRVRFENGIYLVPGVPLSPEFSCDFRYPKGEESLSGGGVTHNRGLCFRAKRPKSLGKTG